MNKAIAKENILFAMIWRRFKILLCNSLSHSLFPCVSLLSLSPFVCLPMYCYRSSKLVVGNIGKMINICQVQPSCKHSFHCLGAKYCNL